MSRAGGSFLHAEHGAGLGHGEFQFRLTGLSEALASASNLPKLDRPIPIVLSGGTAKPRGFMQKFEAAAKAGDFPVQISEIRLAKDPLTATARGCYIAAMSES